MKKFLFIFIVLFLFSCEKEISQLSIRDFAEIEKRHREISDYDLDGEDVSNLEIFVGSSCSLISSLFLDNLQAGLNEWNNVPNTEINIELTDTKSDADIIIECRTRDCDLQGFVDPETLADGDPTTNEIVLNSDFFRGSCGSPSECELTHVIMHEIGHVLGFDHNDRTDDEISEHIEGTPEVDLNSVFNSGTINTDQCQFSAADVLAIQSLYSSCPGEIFGPEYLCANGGGTFCVDDHFNVLNWSGSSNISVTQGSGNCITVELIENKTPTGSVSVTYNTLQGCENTIHTSFDVLSRVIFVLGSPGNICPNTEFEIGIVTDQELSLSWTVGASGSVIEILEEGVRIRSSNGNKLVVSVTATNLCGVTRTETRIINILSADSFECGEDTNGGGDNNDDDGDIGGDIDINNPCGNRLRVSPSQAQRKISIIGTCKNGGHRLQLISKKDKNLRIASISTVSVKNTISYNLPSDLPLGEYQAIITNEKTGDIQKASFEKVK